MTDNIADNENLYNINSWGEGYFKINSAGCIEVSKCTESKGVELKSIILAANQAGLELPILIRFTDILHDRMNTLFLAFSESMSELGYKANYQLVYPIKVNQEYCVLQGLLEAKEHNLGLEAGSKPELMAVIGLLDDKSATIICNGYKDRSYIRAALIAKLMGHKVFLIIEKLSELDLILQEANSLNVEPLIGLRIRLTTVCAGKWENTGGEKSKFGLNAEQVIAVVEQLKEHNRLDCLQLMHCHLGSQIAEIQDIRKCMQEVGRYYTELHRLNVPIKTVDVGGGLGVDYEGIRANTGCSMNYSLKEYASHIILELRDLCSSHNLPEPDIISESGRALTAHHAVLITNITDIEQIKVSSIPRMGSDVSLVLREIYDNYQVMLDNAPLEIYNSAEITLREAQDKFNHGIISLAEKAEVEQVFTTICLDIKHRLDDNNPQDAKILEDLNKRLAAKVFCNLSFFQSLPDAWAIDQVFPITPISQLKNAPTMHSILQDLTCDSDGTIDWYPGDVSVNQTLLLPEFNPKNPYNIAFFLVGAYQEILGNLHNLFGDTNSLEVKLTNDGDFSICNLQKGDTVTDVLGFAHFDTKKLLLSYERQLNKTQLESGKVNDYLDELRCIIMKSTYLNGKKAI